MLKINVLVSHYTKAGLLLIIALFFLVLPHIDSQQYISSTITSKFIYFVYGCLGLMTVFIFFIITKSSVEFSLSKIDIVLLALFIYITLNRYFIQDHYGFSIRYLELLGLSFFYIVLRFTPLKKYYYYLLFCIVISGIIESFYGIFQLLGYFVSNHNGFKMTGSFFNPGPYAGFLVCVWPISLGVYLFRDRIGDEVISNIKDCPVIFSQFVKYLVEYIPLLGLGFIILLLPVLDSRASWIATLVATAVLMELKYKIIGKLFKKEVAKHKKVILIVLAMITISLVLINIYQYKKGSSDGRLLIWKVTSGIVADNPVFGVGFDRFNAVYMNYQAHYFERNGENDTGILADNTKYAFNEILQFLAENGLFGFIFLMGLSALLINFRASDHEDEIFGIIAMIGLVTIAIFAFFSYAMEILPIKLVMFFLLAVLSEISANKNRFNLKTNKRFKYIYIIILILISTFSIYSFALSTQKLNRAFITWQSAMGNYTFGDFEVAQKEYKSVYPTLKDNGDFLMHYGKMLAIQGDYSKAIVMLERAKKYLNNTVIENTLGDSYKAMKQYQKAETSYKRAIDMAPGKFYSSYLLAKLYDDSGQQYQAVKTAQKILEKKIKFQSKAVKEIRYEMKKILVKNQSSGLQN